MDGVRQAPMVVGDAGPPRAVPVHHEREATRPQRPLEMDEEPSRISPERLLTCSVGLTGFEPATP